MNTKKVFVDFVTMFAVSFIVSAIVTLLSNLILHGASTIDWEASFSFAIILSWIGTRRSKCGKESRTLLPGKCHTGQGPVG
jgi:hypothetical protein